MDPFDNPDISSAFPLSWGRSDIEPDAAPTLPHPWMDPRLQAFGHENQTPIFGTTDPSTPAMFTNFDEITTASDNDLQSLHEDEDMTPVTSKSTTKRLRLYTTNTGLNAQYAASNDDPTSHPDSYLLLISRKLMTKTSMDQKPLPCGEPSLWAKDRLSLCETLTGIYQAPQRSLHASGGIARGIMFDAGSSPRDLIDEGVILARIAGGMEAVNDGKGDFGDDAMDCTSDGEAEAPKRKAGRPPKTTKARPKSAKQMVQTKDQGYDSYVRSFTHNIEAQLPVYVILGSKNADVPTKVPHRYNALGWMKPSQL